MAPRSSGGKSVQVAVLPLRCIEHGRCGLPCESSCAGVVPQASSLRGSSAIAFSFP